MKRFHIHLIADGEAGLGIGFEDACAKLAAIPRLHLELDGSFVWVGDQWQVDGMLYDRAERLRYVDLKGHCPRTIWRALVDILSTLEAAPRVVCLPSGGLYDLQTFEVFVWSSTVHGSEAAE